MNLDPSTPRRPLVSKPDWETGDTLRRLLAACDTLSHPVFVHDRDFRILFANSAYLDRAKASLEDILGMPYWQVFPRAQGPLTSCLRALSDGAEEEVEDLSIGAGEIYSCRALAIRDVNDRYLYSVHILVDVTEQRRLEEALRHERALADATIDCAPGVFYVLDTEGRFRRWNRYLNRLTGLADDQLLRASSLSIIHPDDRHYIAAKIQEVFSAGYAEAEARLVLPDKGVRSFSFTGQRFEVDGETYLAGFGVDVTDTKRSLEQMEHLATHDRLTDLPNRNLFFDRLQHSLEKAARRDEHVAVMFVDLDNFKQINDSFGHQMGDLLLMRIAAQLQSCTRRQDTVSRLGGDEFTVIVEDIRESSEEVVAATAERIVKALSSPFDLGGREALLSASVGIAFYPKDGADLASLLKSADTAMYKAKEIGKNNYQFFTEEMNTHAAERHALERDLRNALARDEFFLVYQPKINLRDASVSGVEALLRWQHPQRGLLLPDEFIPLAEATGLIVPIGDWVLRRVCAQIREWSGQGLRDIRVSVNLSPRQFREAGLAGNIQSVLRANGIAATSLEFELTETCVMDDAASATEILQRLKDMGLGLAIDDFGVGYSSLQYLKRFPIDNLKIDSHFIKDLATDADDQAIVDAIITMGHSMRLEVIAEGVETLQQLEFLQATGCDFVQGYYIDRPLSARRAAEVIGRA
jgi:diguanylate cyclase (GGDEF)-like protein/PAS domain S-box-containing protein